MGCGARKFGKVRRPRRNHVPVEASMIGIAEGTNPVKKYRSQYRSSAYIHYVRRNESDTWFRS
jgi:hypothetical protein